MLKKSIFLLMVGILLVGTSFSWASTEFELRGPFIVWDNTKPYDPAKSVKMVNKYAGFGPGIGMYWSNEDQKILKSFLTVQQDLFDHPMVCLGILVNHRLMVSPESFLEFSWGLGIGNEYKYTYLYENGPNDFFRTSMYISPLIPMSMGFGTKVWDRDVSLHLGLTVSLRPAFEWIGSGFGINKALNNDNSSDLFTPAYATMLTMRIGL